MKDFFTSILPTAGLLFSAENQGGGMRHHVCQDASDAAELAQSLNDSGATVYHACASFDKKSYLDASGKKRQRTADNAMFARSFWLDIDCGVQKATDGKGYSDVDEARTALAQFVSENDLPSPLVVNSGGGIHAYWPLQENLPKDQWQVMAADIKRLTHAPQFRLLSDDSRTADIASLLRPVGTFNRKYTPAREVRLLEGGSVVSATDFHRAVQKALTRGKGLAPSASPIACPANQRAATSTIPTTVLQGGRNQSLLSYVGKLRAAGLPEDVIADAVHNFNSARCQPPLDHREVADIVSRYAVVTETAWPDPKPINAELPVVPTFDLSMLPDEFLPFVQDNAERMGQPADFFAVPLMIVAATALGSGWTVCPKAYDEGWKESMVLWGGIVAPPGSKKSPCLGAALRPIHKIAEQLAHEHQQAVDDYNRLKADYTDQQKQLKKPASRAAITQLLREPEFPKPERVLVQDTTYQKLADIMGGSPRGLLCSMDELASVLAKWDEKGQEAARQFFLTSWNGDQPYVVDRIEAGTKQISRAFLCLMGGFQPSILAQYVRQTTAGNRGDDGLVQRFQMLAFPDIPKELIEADRCANQKAEAMMLSAVLKLRNLTAKDVGAEIDLDSGRAFLHFDSQSQVEFDKFRKSVERKIKLGTAGSAMSSHLGKMPGTIAKLALITHLLDGGSGPINMDATTKALRWFKYLFAHAKRIYGSTPTASFDTASLMLRKIKAGDLPSQFTAREVARKGWTGLTSQQSVEGAIEWLVECNWLRSERLDTGGKPKEVYTAHPKALGAKPT
jgi:hypothetical protein